MRLFVTGVTGLAMAENGGFAPQFPGNNSIVLFFRSTTRLSSDITAGPACAWAVVPCQSAGSHPQRRGFGLVCGAFVPNSGTSCRAPGISRTVGNACKTRLPKFKAGAFYRMHNSATGRTKVFVELENDPLPGPSVCASFM